MRFCNNNKMTKGLIERNLTLDSTFAGDENVSGANIDSAWKQTKGKKEV